MRTGVRGSCSPLCYLETEFVVFGCLPVNIRQEAGGRRPVWPRSRTCMLPLYSSIAVVFRCLPRQRCYASAS